MCFTCYREVERAINRNADAREEREAARNTESLNKAQDKMVKALYDQRKLIKVYEEFGVASELLDEDSTMAQTTAPDEI